MVFTNLHQLHRKKISLSELFLWKNYCSCVCYLPLTGKFLQTPFAYGLKENPLKRLKDSNEIMMNRYKIRDLGKNKYMHLTDLLKRKIYLKTYKINLSIC